jgi:tetratricopeptide (TPR) repeat protein
MDILFLTLNNKMKKAISIIIYLVIFSEPSLLGQTINSIIELGIEKCFKEPDSAQLLFDSALRIDSKNKYAIREKLTCFAMHKQIDKALNYANSLTSYDTTDSKYYATKASIYHSYFNDTSCIKFYLKAIEIDSNNIDVYYNLGVFYYNKSLDLKDSLKNVKENQNLIIEQNKYYLNRALIYMEKYYFFIQIEPNSDSRNLSIKVVQQILGHIYTDLKMEAKSREMELKIKNNNHYIPVITE